MLVLALPLVAADWSYPNGHLIASGLFLPPLAEWLHNGIFFVFGRALYYGRAELFIRWRRWWWVFTIAGLTGFLVTETLVRRQARPSDIAFTLGCAAWLWSFASIGFALRFMASRNKVLAYLAGTSYWVYLVHLPLTIAFGALLYEAPFPALSKIAINIVATTADCLLSYELWVRSTWIGELLNGKRLPRRTPPLTTLDAGHISVAHTAEPLPHLPRNGPVDAAHEP